MTLQEKTLCDYYLSHFNKQKAMKQAGYGDNSKKTGKQLEKYLNNKSSMIFAKQYIKDYISEQMKILEGKLIIDRNKLLEYLSKCVAGNMYEKRIINYRDSYELIDVQICIKDRTDAAKLLFKFYDLENKGENQNKDKPKIVNDIKPNNIDEDQEDKDE